MQVSAGFVMGAGCRKNHDKQLTHIVRVSTSIVLVIKQILILTCQEFYCLFKDINSLCNFSEYFIRPIL
jgi:hypothetical protein